VEGDAIRVSLDEGWSDRGGVISEKEDSVFGSDVGSKWKPMPGVWTWGKINYSAK